MGIESEAEASANGVFDAAPGEVGEIMGDIAGAIEGGPDEAPPDGEAPFDLCCEEVAVAVAAQVVAAHGFAAAKEGEHLEGGRACMEADQRLGGNDVAGEGVPVGAGIELEVGEAV